MWGTTFLVVNRVLVTTSPGVFLILRFIIATCIGGAVWLARRDRVTPGLWRDGLRLGVAMFAGFAFQSEALGLTTPARSAFLTGMSVLFVPLLERLVYRRAVKPAAWI